MVIRKSGVVRLLPAAALCLLSFFPLLNVVHAAEMYSNPVLVEMFPMNNHDDGNALQHSASEMIGLGDPAVIFHEGRYYLYATGDNRSYDVYTSPDLVRWQKGPKIFPSAGSNAWAPDVFYDARDRTFYLYYTVRMRISVASAIRPDGLFKDAGLLVRNAIDAHLFQDDDGKYYLYYADYPSFRIFVQPMESPVKKSGAPVQLIGPTDPWEKKGTAVTEAPWMLTHNGTYYLLYSGGGANTADYAIGYAVSKSPLGPFVKFSGNPIVKKGPGIFGPGHCSVTKDRAGNLWMVYHQKTDARKGWVRIICIDPLWFDEQGILHGRATWGTQEKAPVVDSKSTVSFR